MIQSFGVATTLSAQRIVAGLSGTAQKVAYPEGITVLPLGVTKDTVKDITQSIPVAGHGEIAKLYFNDTVAAWGLVTSDTSGRAVPFTAVTAPTAYVGVLVGAAVAATGTIADVLIMPGFKSIP